MAAPTRRSRSRSPPPPPSWPWRGRQHRDGSGERHELPAPRRRGHGPRRGARRSTAGARHGSGTSSSPTTTGRLCAVTRVTIAVRPQRPRSAPRSPALVAVRDRQPPVAAERLRGDLDARGRLAALVLGAVDHPDHALDVLGGQALAHELVGVEVLLHVAREDRGRARRRAAATRRRAGRRAAPPTAAGRSPRPARARGPPARCASAPAGRPSVLNTSLRTAKPPPCRRRAWRSPPTSRTCCRWPAPASRTCSTAPSRRCRGCAPGGSPR